MAYVYLIDMYTLIEQRLADAKKALENNEDNPVEKRFHEGRIETLSDFKNFIEKNYIPRLPRRIIKDFYKKQ